MNRRLASVLVVIVYFSCVMAGKNYDHVFSQLPTKFAVYIQERLQAQHWNTAKFGSLMVPEGTGYCYMATVKLDNGSVAKGTIRVLAAEIDGTLDLNGGVQQPDKLAVYVPPTFKFVDQPKAYQTAEQDFRGKVQKAGLNCEYFATVEAVVQIDINEKSIGTFLVVAFVAYDDDLDASTFGPITSVTDKLWGQPITMEVKKFEGQR